MNSKLVYSQLANGQFLPEDSMEMQAMVAYMNWFAEMWQQWIENQQP